ncbi:hypothetical protein [Phaeovulum sp. NW3]|uniref:hypothetical protein n=1 Tax=Phaeovulum sp. NW3 TaxID=2934933 RepID=UPI002021E4BD|nr:hypothetical protein [Phaeovulum sp. NW3]MCL7464190.1 hypothetical protein [Phaeovulum sp. NW3]
MNPQPPRPQGSSSGGIYFVLGAIVVALVVVIWLVMDSPAPTGTPEATAPEAPASVTITNEAPDTGVVVTPSPEPAEPAAPEAPAAPAE